MSHLLYQLDLEGADSWTVAAECAALGDTAMLDDLKAGVKPAQAVALIYLHGEAISRLDPGEIKKLWKAQKNSALVKERDALPEWLYPAAKSTVHGYCYGSGWMTTRDTILNYSMADLPLDLGNARPIALSKGEIEKLRGCCASRYPGVALWHAKEGREMMSRGLMEMPSGHVRHFWGLKREWKQGREQPNHETLREWLASRPQYNTTYALKVALHKLWHDSANRRDGLACSWSGCGKPAIWEDALSEQPIGGRLWCGDHAIRGTVASLIPYRNPPVPPCSERSFAPVREVVAEVTGGKTTAQLVAEARWRRKR